jgi:hypothetical protein
MSAAVGHRLRTALGLGDVGPWADAEAELKRFPSAFLYIFFVSLFFFF